MPNGLILRTAIAEKKEVVILVQAVIQKVMVIFMQVHKVLCFDGGTLLDNWIIPINIPCMEVLGVFGLISETEVYKVIMLALRKAAVAINF